MELRQLNYFLKAKELLNFTAAAAELNISQSTLSQQIKQLEIELDTPLFHRIGKRIILTEAGSLFYDYALQSVSKASSGMALLKDLKDLKTGELYIGVTYGLRYILTPALIQFLELYPKISIQIVFGTSEELYHKLLKLELDFILTFADQATDENLSYKLLFESPLCLITSTYNTLASKKEITLPEIGKLTLALPANGYSTRQFINETFTKNNIIPNIPVEVNDIPTLLELVKAGNWYTILAKTTVQDYDDLCVIPIKGKKMLRKAMIISMKNVYEKKAAHFFCALLMNKTGLKQSIQ